MSSWRQRMKENKYCKIRSEQCRNGRKVKRIATENLARKMSKLYAFLTVNFRRRVNFKVRTTREETFELKDLTLTVYLG